MIRGMSRGALVLGPALMALMLAVQPVAGQVAISSSGHPGEAMVFDTHLGRQGANCDYKASGSSGSHPLKDISVRGPKIWAEDTGSGIQHQWVGWSYKIQRDTNFDNQFGTYFTSGVVKKFATEGTPVSFARRTWTAPSNLKAGNYRVLVTVYWYKHGSSTQQRGDVVARIEFYHVLGGGPDTVRHNDCYSAN